MENQTQNPTRTALLDRDAPVTETPAQQRWDSDMDNASIQGEQSQGWRESPTDSATPEGIAQRPNLGGAATDSRDPHIQYAEDNAAPAQAELHQQTDSSSIPVADDDDRVVSEDEEIIRVVHAPKDENDSKPWELKFENVGALKRARAILNYPVHQFETEEKAREVAEMLRDIIKADAVEVNGTFDEREEGEAGKFFQPVT